MSCTDDPGKPTRKDERAHRRVLIDEEQSAWSRIESAAVKYRAASAAPPCSTSAKSTSISAAAMKGKTTATSAPTVPKTSTKTAPLTKGSAANSRAPGTTATRGVAGTSPPPGTAPRRRLNNAPAPSSSSATTGSQFKRAVKTPLRSVKPSSDEGRDSIVDVDAMVPKSGCVASPPGSAKKPRVLVDLCDDDALSPFPKERHVPPPPPPHHDRRRGLGGVGVKTEQVTVKAELFDDDDQAPMDESLFDGRDGAPDPFAPSPAPASQQLSGTNIAAGHDEDRMLAAAASPAAPNVEVAQGTTAGPQQGDGMPAPSVSDEDVTATLCASIRNRLFPYQLDGIRFLEAQRREVLARAVPPADNDAAPAATASRNATGESSTTAPASAGTTVPTTPPSVTGGCLLADEMGLGKTVQVAAFIGHVLTRGDAETCLVICPPTLVDVWADALEEWTNLPRGSVERVDGSKTRKQRDKIWAGIAERQGLDEPASNKVNNGPVPDGQGGFVGGRPAPGTESADAFLDSMTASLSAAASSASNATPSKSKKKAPASSSKTAAAKKNGKKEGQAVVGDGGAFLAAPRAGVTGDGSSSTAAATRRRRPIVCLSSYTVMCKDIDTIAPLRFDFAVFDEAHKVKDTTTQAHKAAKMLTATNKIAITGTPLQNNFVEIWAIFEVCDPTCFDGMKRSEAVELSKAVARANERDATLTVRYGALEEYERRRQQLSKKMLRREKKDLFKHPAQETPAQPANTGSAPSQTTSATEASMSNGSVSMGASAEALSSCPLGGPRRQLTHMERREKQMFEIEQRHNEAQRQLFMKTVGGDVEIAAPPKKEDLVVWVKLDKPQVAQYQSFLNSEPVQGALKNIKAGHPLVLLTSLKKICDHTWLNYTPQNFKARMRDPSDERDDSFGLLEESGKVAATVGLIKVHIAERPEETKKAQSSNNIENAEASKTIVGDSESAGVQGEKTLVFSSSKRLLQILAWKLKAEGIAFCRVDGDVSPDRRSKIVKEFNNPTNPTMVCLLTIQVGGVGLTFSGATRVILLDPSWNPATDDQAVDRVHRIGQKKAVKVYRLISTGTVEEKVYRNQIFKLTSCRQLLGRRNITAGASNGELDVTAIHRYFTHAELRSMFEAPTVDETLTADQIMLVHPGATVDAATAASIAGVPSISAVSNHGALFGSVDEAGDADVTNAKQQKQEQKLHSAVASMFGITPGKQKQKGGAAALASQASDAVGMSQEADDDLDSIALQWCSPTRRPPRQNAEIPPKSASAANASSNNSHVPELGAKVEEKVAESTTLPAPRDSDDMLLLDDGATASSTAMATHVTIAPPMISAPAEVCENILRSSVPCGGPSDEVREKSVDPDDPFAVADDVEERHSAEIDRRISQSMRHTATRASIEALHRQSQCLDAPTPNDEDGVAGADVSPQHLGSPGQRFSATVALTQLETPGLNHTPLRESTLQHQPAGATTSPGISHALLAYDDDEDDLLPAPKHQVAASPAPMPMPAPMQSASSFPDQPQETVSMPPPFAAPCHVAAAKSQVLDDGEASKDTFRFTRASLGVAPSLSENVRPSAMLVEPCRKSAVFCPEGRQSMRVARLSLSASIFKQESAHAAAVRKTRVRHVAILPPLAHQNNRPHGGNGATEESDATSRSRARPFSGQLSAPTSRRGSAKSSKASSGYEPMPDEEDGIVPLSLPSTPTSGPQAFSHSTAVVQGQQQHQEEVVQDPFFFERTNGNFFDEFDEEDEEDDGEFYDSEEDSEADHDEGAEEAALAVILDTPPSNPIDAVGFAQDHDHCNTAHAHGGGPVNLAFEGATTSSRNYGPGEIESLRPPAHSETSEMSNAASTFVGIDGSQVSVQDSQSSVAVRRGRPRTAQRRFVFVGKGDAVKIPVLRGLANRPSLPPPEFYGAAGGPGGRWAEDEDEDALEASNRSMLSPAGGPPEVVFTPTPAPQNYAMLSPRTFGNESVDGAIHIALTQPSASAAASLDFDRAQPFFDTDAEFAADSGDFSDPDDVGLDGLLADENAPPPQESVPQELFRGTCEFTRHSVFVKSKSRRASVEMGTGDGAARASQRFEPHLQPVTSDATGVDTETPSQGVSAVQDARSTECQEPTNPPRPSHENMTAQREAKRRDVIDASETERFRASGEHRALSATQSSTDKTMIGGSTSGSGNATIEVAVPSDENAAVTNDENGHPSALPTKRRGGLGLGLGERSSAVTARTSTPNPTRRALGTLTESSVHPDSSPPRKGLSARKGLSVRTTSTPASTAPLRPSQGTSMGAVDPEGRPSYEQMAAARAAQRRSEGPKTLVPADHHDPQSATVGERQKRPLADISSPRAVDVFSQLAEANHGEVVGRYSTQETAMPPPLPGRCSIRRPSGLMSPPRGNVPAAMVRSPKKQVADVSLPAAHTDQPRTSSTPSTSSTNTNATKISNQENQSQENAAPPCAPAALKALRPASADQENAAPSPPRRKRPSTQLESELDALRRGEPGGMRLSGGPLSPPRRGLGLRPQ